MFENHQWRSYTGQCKHFENSVPYFTVSFQHSLCWMIKTRDKLGNVRRA